MRHFKEFIKRANTHQTHFEDLVLLGKEGLEELNDKIEKFLKKKEDKNIELNTTTKIDGSPCCILFSSFEGYPDNSICLKSFVNNANNCLSSEEDIMRKYGDRPEMAEKLKYCLELSHYIPKGEAWQGDCLFTKLDLIEQEINGIKYLTFHPNKIVYAFSEDNIGYEKVKNAEFGIAFHTIYKDAGNGSKSQSFKVDLTRLDVPSKFYLMSPNVNTSSATFDDDKIADLYSKLLKAEEVLNSNEDYENLVHNGLFMDYWNTFENFSLADKKRTTIDEETAYNDLIDFIRDRQEKKFAKKLSTLKSDKGIKSATEKYNSEVEELKNIVATNKEVIINIVRALNLAADIKMSMWYGYKSINTGVNTFYRSRTRGFFPANIEGIAMSDADGNIVKIVDRSEFSNANRDPDIMSGWEHPNYKESLIKRKNRKFVENNSRDDTVVIAFGRMNPPTLGHLKLVKKMQELAKENNCEARLYLSHSVDKKNERKNPLTYESKIKWAKKAFGDMIEVVESDAKTIIFVLHDLMLEGFKNIIYVGGEDRIGGDEDITATISKYNGYPTKDSMFYEFDSIEFENAGSRDETSEDLYEKASASLARKYVIENDFDSFCDIEPFDIDECGKLFEELQDRMEV